MQENENSSAAEDDIRFEAIGMETEGGGTRPRARSLIASEHQHKLNKFYRVNPRPFKADLESLRSRTALSKRVVQVWFQNMRARDHRKARVVRCMMKKQS